MERGLKNEAQDCDRTDHTDWIPVSVYRIQDLVHRFHQSESDGNHNVVFRLYEREKGRALGGLFLRASGRYLLWKTFGNACGDLYVHRLRKRIFQPYFLWRRYQTPDLSDIGQRAGVRTWALCDHVHDEKPLCIFLLSDEDHIAGAFVYDCCDAAFLQADLRSKPKT